MPLFGTDGIRGTYGSYPITEEFCERLAKAAVLTSPISQQRVDPQPSIMIARDTRLSGPSLESTFTRACLELGVDVYSCGVIPTPLLAFLVSTSQVSMGLMISASHNPDEDNGFKFFDENGCKYDVDWEDEVERKIDENIEYSPSSKGNIKQFVIPDLYFDRCLELCPSKSKNGNIKVVVDCANGAWSEYAPRFLRNLGFEVVVIGEFHEGARINDGCGSTYLDFVRSHVQENNADLGIAFDGDGDRVLLVDHLGNTVTGDQILYLLALRLKKTSGSVPGVVGTVMTNGALDAVFNDIDIELVRVSVGDRNISEELRRRIWHIGGEASGHLINTHVSPAGDGLLAALQVLALMQLEEKSLNELLSGIQLHTQALKNMSLNASGSSAWILEHPTLKSLIEFIESKPHINRVLLRESGTEPLLRIMVEGSHPEWTTAYPSDIERCILDLKP